MPSRPTALIIMQEASQRRELRRCLELLGLEVAEESTGSRGVDRVLNREFDVVLCEENAPVFSAGDVQKILRSIEIRVPVVCIECEQSNLISAPHHVTLGPAAALTELRSVLIEVLPDGNALQPFPVGEELVELEQAAEEQDYRKLIDLTCKLRELSKRLGSPELLDTVCRLSDCLEKEALQEESQLVEIKATLSELGIAFAPRATLPSHQSPLNQR